MDCKAPAIPESLFGVDPPIVFEVLASFEAVGTGGTDDATDVTDAVGLRIEYGTFDDVDEGRVLVEGNRATVGDADERDGDVKGDARGWF